MVNKDYRKVRITIAFHPLDERFEVSNPAIAKDSAWIRDVAPLVSGAVDLFDAVDHYLAQNPSAEKQQVKTAILNLLDVAKKQIGLIELSHDLDIETVTEVFIRINSKGTVLSQADFAMSKIAADQKYGGPQLRKCIDYFCHLAVAPEFYGQIRDNDAAFAATDYFQKMSWLKEETDDLYDPSYSDMLRVAFTSHFNRGKLADLVSLLSGRNFETKTYEEEVAAEAFARLDQGVRQFINETHFKRYTMIVRSAGFVASKMIRSQNVLNFGYVLYLKLKAAGVSSELIGRYVPRWLVLAILTDRYTGSAETEMDFDVRQLASRDFKEFLEANESGKLSDTFWTVELPQKLQTSGTSSPYFWVFIAAQVKAKDKGFLSRDITVQDLVTHLGDIHHIFPRDYLKQKGLSRAQYNQIANYAYTQEEINIKVGKKAPAEYMSTVRSQCEGGSLHYGAIDTHASLMHNLAANAIPDGIFGMRFEHYPDFLSERRALMAAKIRGYYDAL